MGRRMVVLLAAAAVALAMLAVSGSAWAQDAGQADGGGVQASAQGDPVIKPRTPKPGSRITDRSPTIKAKVFDRNDRLRKSDIKLFLDRDRIDRSDFTYRASRELLTFTPDERLSRGKHTVKITAGPKGDRATRSWSFTIKRNR